MENNTTTIANIKTALSTAFTGASSDMMDVVATIVPIALGIFVAVWVVKKGKNVFSSLSNK